MKKKKKKGIDFSDSQFSRANETNDDRSSSMAEGSERSLNLRYSTLLDLAFWKAKFPEKSVIVTGLYRGVAPDGYRYHDESDRYS